MVCFQNGQKQRMTNPLVRSTQPVTLVGGGDASADDVKLALKQASTLVAADGGADLLVSMDLEPEAVIGDLDSLSAATKARIPQDRLFPIREQDSTDFDKAVRSILTPVILGVGFLGARVDHQLAAFNVLARQSHVPCILIGAHEIVFLLPPELRVQLAAGEVVSLFPMAEARARSRGLEWPLDGLEMNPVGFIGTSNRAVGGEMWISTRTPTLLAMLPRHALDQVMPQVARGPGQVAPWRA